ncbi:hypothetical protein HN873_072033 [Arachis hypogaea]|nr:F-box protein [Arachis hypogaea]
MRCATNPIYRFPKPARNWLDLPYELTAEIMSKVGAFDIFANGVEEVCTLWRRVCNDPYTWRTIHIGYYLGLRGPFKRKWIIMRKFDDSFHRAIRRSCGQVVDLSLQYIFFVDTGCSLQQLRRLQLVKCDNTEILIEMAKGFPLLEELDINLCDMYEASVTLEVIGQRCRRLKSLKFNMSGSKGNQDAYAIAQNMPNLRYLQLCMNNLDNNGLSAIFSGCPNLEYIDLGWCSNVDLEGSWLALEYADKIVDLRYLHASMEDYGKMYDRGRPSALLMDYYYDLQFGEPFDERGNFIGFIHDLTLVSEDELKLEWKEEVDGICEIAILQRWHRSRNVTSFKEFRRYCQETKNTKSSNGKKHGRRAWKINYKSLYL